MIKTFETIDKLYLEWSQGTSARTERELQLSKALGLALTCMMFDAERAAREQDGVALKQLHDAIVAARAALAR